MLARQGVLVREERLGGLSKYVNKTGSSRQGRKVEGSASMSARQGALAREERRAKAGQRSSVQEGEEGMLQDSLWVGEDQNMS